VERHEASIASEGRLLAEVSCCILDSNLQRKNA
jgi:hypothetical protein